MPTDPTQVAKLLRPSSGLVSGSTASAWGLRQILGMPARAALTYSQDDSGVLARPSPGAEVAPTRRAKHVDWNAAHQYLTGENGVKSGTQYAHILRRNLSIKTRYGAGWVELPNLYFFLRTLVFPAAAEALCGKALLDLNPTFTANFWEYDGNVPKFLQGWPRWLRPGMYRNRDKMLRSIRKWHEHAHAHSDCTRLGPADPEWDEYFGSKYIRARHSAWLELDVFREDLDARASSDLGLMFA